MDYQALKTYIEGDPELSALAAAGADESIAQAMNARLVPTIGKVESHDIRQYLMLVDLLLTIEGSDTPACKAAKRALEVFPIFDLAQPMILAKFTAVLDGLVADTLVPDFTEEHKTTIIGLAYHNLPAFGTTVSNMDVAKALRG